LFEEFGGDCVANWGRPGAEHSSVAYMKGLANLYVPTNSDQMNFAKNKLVLAGTVIGKDLQDQVNQLVDSKREINSNIRLSNLVSDYEKRTEFVLSTLLAQESETILFVGGGDRGIYSAGKALGEALILVRIDPHMDERSVYCRSDPSLTDQFYPHSGNGVSHLKQDDLVIGDFLLGSDDARNNDQCRFNSTEAEKRGVLTRKIDRDELRIEPKKLIDQIVEEVNGLMKANPKAKLILNIDADRNC